MAEFLSEMEGVQMENDAGDRNPGELKRLDKGKQVLVGHQGDGSGDYNKGDQQIQGGGAENTFLAMQETQGNGDRVAIKAKPIPMVTDESKPRLRWTYELHECFLDAVTRLGGAKSATPKTILNVMDIDGLHRLQVKSHLQKYRTGKISPTDWQDTSRNGGPRRLRPLSTVPSMIFKKRRARSGRSRKEEHGVLYMKIRACKHDSGGSAFRQCSYGQPWASPGIFTTIPVPFCFGTVTELPQFYLNQQDACLQTYGTLNGLANLSLQELPSGYQPQTYLDPAPDAFTTPNGSSANSYQETSPVLPGSEVEMDQPDDEDSLEVKTPNSSSASSYQVTWPVLPGSDVEMVQPDDEDSVEVMTPNGSSASSYSPVLPGSEVEMVWPDDEDPLEAFLNWNDDEPINLDALNFKY